MNARTARRRVPFALACFFGLRLTHAATFTWDNVTGNWSNELAWTPDGVPVSATDTTLVFGGSDPGQYLSVHDLPGVFQLNGMQFNSTATATNVINSFGGTLSFASNGATTPTMMQNGSGAIDITVGFEAASALTFGGTGTGIVSLGGAIAGPGGLTFNSGNWRLTNPANTFTGGVTIDTGAQVEVAPGGALNITVAASSILGSNSAPNPLTINGGTLKLTTTNGGNITLGTGRPVAFGQNGGLLDITNSNGGHMANNPNDFSLAVNSAIGTPAVVRFNGGPNGLSNNSTTNGNWSENNNALRFSGFSGAGALRIELINGAMLRAGNGGASPQSIGLLTTWRGVVGGDPTSGPTGVIDSGTSRDTGRIALNVNEIGYSSLTLEGALQMCPIGASRALNGTIVVAGSASGAAGYINFTGRGTNTQLASPVAAPGAGTGTAQQHPLWLLRNSNGTLTIADGGIAAFDVRLRTDTNGRNGNGVALDGPATIQAGGTLLIHQSLTNFTPGVASTIANAGDVIIYGDITGTGNSAKEAVLSIKLPEPQPFDPADYATARAMAIPFALTAAATLDSERPYGGLRFDDTRGSADFIINGSGFGGLRVNALPRPEVQMSSTGFLGGPTMPDPVSTASKVASILTATRLSRLSGTGGYLTVAPQEALFNFPIGGEWAPSVPVGLKVVNSNSSGVDVSLGAVTTFSHNVAVDAGATLDLGAAAPFLFDNNAVVHGKGTVLSGGSVSILPGSSISPGLGDVGTLSVATTTLTIAGGVSIDVQGDTADVLAVSGNLDLGGPLTVGGSFGTTDVVIASYTGNLVGTFSAITGVPPVFSVNYGTGSNSTIRLMYSTDPVLVWNGTPAATWSVGGGNWKNGATFANGAKVRFDGTASGSTSVTISGSDVQPLEVTVDANTVNYSITSSAGAALAGGGRLIKNGDMALTLMGPASFAGGTIVNAGTLILGSINAIPDVGGVTIAAGATLNTQGNSDTINDLTVNGTVTGGGTLTVNKLILGSGGTFSSNLVLNDRVNKAGAAPSTISGSVDLTATTRVMSVDASSTLNVTGTISNGALTKEGDGQLILAPVLANTFFGGTTVLAGKLTVGQRGIPASSAVTVAAGATLDLGHGAPLHLASLDSSGAFNITDAESLTLDSLSGTGGSLNGADSITLNQAGTTTYGGSITGVTSVSMNGTGQITLSGASTYSGGLFANSGRVVLTGASAGGSGIVRVLPGGKVASGAGLTSRVDLLGGTFFGVGSPGSAASNDFVATAGNTTTVSLSDPDNAGVRSEVIVTGTLKGSGDITSVISTNAPHPDGGVGFRLRGTGPSDFTGTIFVGQSVKFEVQTGQAGPFSPAGNGKIVFTAGEFTGGLNGNYSQFNVRNNFAGNTIIGNNVEVVGTGFVNMNMAGTGADGAVSRLGNLRIGGQQIGVNKNGAPNQVLEFTSVTLTGGDPTFSPTTPGFGAGATGDMRLGPISELAAGSGIIVNGQTTLTLAGANTYTGTTKIVNGTVRLAVPGALPPNSPLVVDGGTLDLNTPSGSSDQTVPSLAGVGGVITNTDTFTTRTLNVVQNTDTVYLGGFGGNVALSKSGTGVLTLGGFVNAPASTTVNAGMLAVNGSLTGAVTVQNAGSLGGTGIIDGSVQAKLGGAIAPGTGPGTLTVAQVALESDAFLMIELGKATPGGQPLPTDYDILSVVGTATLGGSSLVLTPGAGIEQNDVFTILMNDGVDPVTGIFGGLPNGALFTVAGQAFRISYFDDGSTPAVLELAGGNDVALLAVPEPGSAALLLGGLAIAAMRRPRRS